MRSLFLCSIVLLLGLAPFASSSAAETPQTLPLSHAGISLLAQPRDEGWALHFQLANVVDGAQIRYRRFGAEEWRTLPQMGELVGPLEIGPIGTGEQIIEAEVIDQEGEGRGRFRLSFDPEKERIRQARYLLDHVLPNNWVGFGGTNEGEIYAYFGTVWGYKEALRSIRYSLDSCDLDRTPESSYGPIPSRFTYLCIQVVYADGESSSPRIFFQKRPEVLTRRPPRPKKPAGPLSMTPSDPGAESSVPVRLKTSRASNGWTLRFEVEDWASVAEYRYRLETDTAWRSTGELPWINPNLGRRSTNPEFVLDPLRVTLGRQKVEVQLLGTDGAISGPYTLWFDPDEEILATAKTDLGDPERSWGTFGEGGDRSLFYFTVFEVRDALGEIRYSIDDCAVGQKFEFPTWNDIAQSPPNPDTTTVWLPKTTEYVCVQLAFTDGEVSEVRRFEHR